MHVRVNLLHKRFDSLYVTEFDEEASKKYRQSVWKCKCDCGNEVSIPAFRLLNKEKTSCGHCNDPKPGDVFDGYTVKELDVKKSKEKQHKFYICECVCGNIRSVAKSDLINKKATNCGCLASLNKRDTEDITNKRFIHWVAKRYNKELSEKMGTTMWDCVCDCGTEKAISISALKLRKTTSCGCCADETKKEKAAQREQERPNWKILKKLYYAMLRRCNDPDDKEAKNYSLRGIKVCDRWSDPEHGFDNFYNDMISSYSPGLTLDRIDVNKNYEPDNCRWITLREQSYNKRNTRYVEYYGTMLCVGEIGHKFNNLAGVSSSRLNTRLLFGFSMDEALQIPTGIRSRDQFYKENPDFKVIQKPFMLQEELDKLHLTGRIIRYDLGEGKLTGKDLERFIRRLPTAEEYWGLDKKDENNKDTKEENK